MSISQVMARFVCGAGADAPGEAATAAARTTIADVVGCIVAGAPTETAAIVRRVAVAGGAPGAATVAGSGRRVAAQAAALANGTAAHALDYDDILWTLYGHPSVSVLPAALAVAETVRASGRELIAAYAIGVELIGKLGRAVNPRHYEHGWHATASIGVVGAAAAAARLLGLDERRTAMALGIAASEACGVRRNFGTMTKPFHAGNAARGGVLAAELAREGFTSDLTAFEGEFGWAATLNARTALSADTLADTLGRPWELVDPGIVLKRYPACGGTHCALDAVIAIRDEHRIEPHEIERIVCDASPFAKKVLLYPRPRTGLEGKFSMEYSLAVAAVEGEAGLRHYEDAFVQDARVQALLPRIEFRTRADLEPPVSADAVPAEVTVHARGTSFVRQVRVPSGDPRNPMTTAQRREKFAGCTRGLLPGAVSERLFDELERLEACTDLSALVAPLRELPPATGDER